MYIYVTYNVVEAPCYVANIGRTDCEQDLDVFHCTAVHCGGSMPITSILFMFHSIMLSDKFGNFHTAAMLQLLTLSNLLQVSTTSLIPESADCFLLQSLIHPISFIPYFMKAL